MNDVDLKLQFAEFEAKKLIKKYGICAPEHIRLRDIAYDLGAVVVEGPMKNSAASLVRAGGVSTIRVSETDSPERQRFSIAHELGHLILKHTHEIKKICTPMDMVTWYSASKETQANFFAGELVIPEKLIKGRCDIGYVGFGPIIKAAREFRVSLTAMTIRFVRFCPEDCAIVFSLNNKIVWFYKSDSWWPFIRKDQSLDKGTLAYDFFQGKSLPETPEYVDAGAWVNASGIDEIIEHSIGSSRLNFVLSLLYFKEPDYIDKTEPLKFDRHLKIMD